MNKTTNEETRRQIQQHRDAKRAKQQAQISERIIQLLLCAGHVKQERVDQARRLASL